MHRSLVIIAMLALTGVACDATREGEPDAAYVDTVERWRAERRARLLADDGYLNLAGLHWLEPGSHTFGADADNEVVFPGGAGAIGYFQVSDDGVRMIVNDDVGVRIGGNEVRDALLPDDTTDDHVLATHGSLTWGAINRDGKFAIRVRDLDHPALAALPPLPYYDIDAGWRVEARLVPYREPRTIAVRTVIEWLGWHPESPGIVEFEIDGVRHSLEAYRVGDRLFFVFADRTSGRDTYGAGRFLSADMPGTDGVIVLDFNFAYNPPCVFNDFSTCPVASPGNRLGIAVTAGEKYDDSLYFGS